MRRRALRAGLATVAAAWTTAAAAQGVPPEVCVVYQGPAAVLGERLDELAAGLRAQRLEAGRDVVVLPRAAAYDLARLPELIADCIARRVRVIAAVGPVVVEAARTATTTIPIVANDLETDPVAAGIVASLAHPGGNLTGVYFDFPGVAAKWLELIGEAVPGLRRIGVLWDPGTGAVQVAAVRALAAARGLALSEQTLTDVGQADAHFKVFAAAGSQAVLMLSSPLIGPNGRLFADAARTSRLPAITMFPAFAEAGGLMAYGLDVLAYYRPMGELIGKILHGADPANLPIERPTRMRLVLNLATAKALGISLPPSLLGRADDVIE